MKLRVIVWTVALIPALAEAVIAVDGDFRFQRLDVDEWRAEYCFAKPVDAIRFDRPVEESFRRNHWTPEDTAFELRVNAEGVAELWRKDGKTFTCAAVNVRTWTGLPNKNYYAFSPFSDGGMSVYTGYYTGSARRDGEWQETQLAAEYLGRDGEQAITREPGLLVHQFVYFGRQQLLETDGLIAVIDPAMPTSAREKILETVPAVNAMLGKTFGFRPAAPYMIFMATDLDAFDGFSVKGGALPGQIEFMLKGRGVMRMLEENPLYYPKATAHEVIHLWQNDHWFETLGSDRPWVHEGSADALAFEVMRYTGIYDDARYAEAWQQVEADCLEQLRKESVHSGPESGNFDVAYKCGALVNRLVGEILNPGDPGAGIVRLWQAMAARPAEERKGESEVLFFRALKTLGVGEVKIRLLKDFLDQRLQRPELELAQLRQLLQQTEWSEIFSEEDISRINELVCAEEPFECQLFRIEKFERKEQRQSKESPDSRLDELLQQLKELRDDEFATRAIACLEGGWAPACRHLKVVNVEMADGRWKVLKAYRERE